MKNVFPWRFCDIHLFWYVWKTTLWGRQNLLAVLYFFQRCFSMTSSVLVYVGIPCGSWKHSYCWELPVYRIAHTLAGWEKKLSRPACVRSLLPAFLTRVQLRDIFTTFSSFKSFMSQLILFAMVFCFVFRFGQHVHSTLNSFVVPNLFGSFFLSRQWMWNKTTRGSLRQ